MEKSKKLCPTCLSTLQKQLKKDRPSFSKRRDLIRLLLFIQIPGQQKDQFYINLFNFSLYLGYDFSVPIPNKKKLPRDVQSSLSVESMKIAEEFILSVKDFIGKKLELFKEESIAVSIMENFTGQKGYPASEENQAWHSDYGAEGLQ